MDTEKPSRHGHMGQADSLSGGFSGMITVGEGRTEVTLQVGTQGMDCFLRVTGGMAHVGAVATASEDLVQLSVVGNHKEGPLAELCAGNWTRLTGNVCVAMVGIHQDQATPAEIDAIVDNVGAGLQRLMDQWRQWGSPARGGDADLETLMIRWCHEAAGIARHYHRQTGDLAFKYANEAVTEADRQIETLLRGRIGEAFPDDLIVGEEFGGPDKGTDQQGRCIWQIDPIDGTLNYALGLPDYCTSLAVMSGHNVLGACIHQPATGDTFSAMAGQGARLNGEPIRVGAQRDLKDSIISLHLKKDGLIMGDPQLLHTLLGAPMKVRRCGAVALEMAWVAAGFYDLLLASFPDRIHLWDIAAGLLLIQEAGGVAVDFRNRPYRLESPAMMVGSAKVAGQLVPLL